jgi:hypothetical protein
MTVWYPTPRRLASCFAQAKAWGCRRMDTGQYLSRPFGGLPILGIERPNLRSSACRNTSRSFSVKRLALEKSNSSSLRIVNPFCPCCLSRADDSNSIGVTLRKNNDQNTLFAFSKQFFADFLIRMFRIHLIPSQGHVKQHHRILEVYAVLCDVCGGLLWIPFKSHVNGIYRNSECQAGKAQDLERRRVFFIHQNNREVVYA